MRHILVDEKLTIELLNKLSPIIEIGKIFFCLVLEKYDSVYVEPKRNVLLKIMEF